MSDYHTLLAQKVASLGSSVAAAARFQNTYGPWLNTYKGGCSTAWLSAIAAIESNGQMVAGDPSLGEYGFFQVASSTESNFGVPDGTRMSPEGNIFLASLEYNVTAAQLVSRYSGWIESGTWDQWFMARLVFEIGQAGTDACFKAAQSAGYLSAGAVYQGIRDWADATGAMAIGSSDADKIWYRIAMIQDVIWPIASALGAFSWWVGSPAPPTPFVPYRLPVGLSFPTSMGALLAAAFVAAGIVIYALRV